MVVVPLLWLWFHILREELLYASLPGPDFFSALLSIKPKAMQVTYSIDLQGLAEEKFNPIMFFLHWVYLDKPNFLFKCKPILI